MTGTLPVYRPTARALHWAVALLVIATIPAGQIMIMEGLSRPVQNALFIFHKNVGPLILLLVIARLVFRSIYPPPPLPDSVPAIQQRISGIVHALLYLFLIIMAVSGYVRVSAGGFPIEYWDAIGMPRLIGKNEGLADTAKAIHATARFGLVILILMHIGAALFHGIVKRDGVLSRMLPSLSR